MSIQSYTVTRNVKAKDGAGRPVQIALASIIHENGTGQTVAIPEDLIKFAGESIIAQEVARAVASPGQGSLK